MQVMLEVDERHWWYRGRRRVLRVELDRLPLPAGAQVLDAGCGSGRMLQELERYGEVRGLERDLEAAQVAQGRDHGEVLTGRLEELPWDASRFDLITCLDVIEHVPDDLLALRELRRVSKPRGWLVVTVPAYKALWSAHDEVNHHYRRYSRRMLQAAAIESGWSMRRMTSFNTLLLAPAAAVRLAQRRRSRPTESFDLQLGPDWLNGALEAPLRIEARWLARGRTLAAGMSLLAVLQNDQAAA